MAKQLKLKIKNIQLAKAAGLEKEKKSSSESEKVDEKPKLKPGAEETAPRRKAKTKSSFAPQEEEKEEVAEVKSESKIEEIVEEIKEIEEPEIEEEIIQETLIEESKEVAPIEPHFVPPIVPVYRDLPLPQATATPPSPPPVREKFSEKPPERAYEKLGPTGRHVKDFYTSPPKSTIMSKTPPSSPPRQEKTPEKPIEKTKSPKPASEFSSSPPSQITSSNEEDKFSKKKMRDFKDVKQPRKEMRPFDARDRQGLTEGEEERWRKRRPIKTLKKSEEPIIRPTKLSIRLPISIKDLASEMKLKASELIQKLFLQGMIYTVNDILDEDTIVLLLGSEFGCEITIDTKEEERIQITKSTIQEEIRITEASQLETRPPVAVFMGHVDHGKTSLIDTIRKSNIAKTEAGAITQHIGAFRCKTPVGDITILDTPGHAAFSAMRARGAEVTDIVVLVVAGDEGIREQTMEAIQHAKAAQVTIVVAVNKCDKPNFNPENVYRQLADADLLPESWGGTIITVNTSAVTGQGIPQLLEMLALQAEVLELKANPHTRARGTVLESEMHKGFGATATVLVQNGTLRHGDAIVLENHWGRIKTMRDEFGHSLKEAPPATPVEITGLSGVPEAGDSFIVVSNEKEARDIAETRALGTRAKAMIQKKPASLETLLKEDAAKGKKILKLIIRSDVQGSLEALKATLEKIESEKVDLEIIFTGVGEVTESDVQLAAASNAIILGFHTQVESRASGLMKELGVTTRLHNIIYHAVDDVKSIMQGLLDKIAQENDTGRAEVRALFKASQLGVIAGCQVIEGTIARSHHIRVEREGKVIWKGTMASLKRVKEDVREVKKGMECGILLQNYNEVQVGDFLQAYEIIYLTQEI